MDTFVWRHPLITLSLITFVIGFALDAVVEIFCVSKRVYAYTQVPEFGSIFVGLFPAKPALASFLVMFGALSCRRNRSPS